MIAALYVETGGAYYGLEDVDPWDEERDARLYDGPWPVVAHPPCARWCAVSELVESLLGDGYRVGEDGGCFEAALAAVRTFGGVLEHPAHSRAWPRYGLPTPGREGWTRSFFDDGWTTEISQSAYGHLTRKRTWLYYVGPKPPTLRWNEPHTTGQVTAFGYRPPKGAETSAYRAAEYVRRGKTVILDKGKSNTTPPAFRDALIDMARTAHTRSDAGQAKEGKPVISEC